MRRNPIRGGMENLPETDLTIMARTVMTPKSKMEI
jgi:hypothetical protein